MSANDAQRLEAVFDNHSAAVFAYLLRRTDRATAEDALSETFLVAWRRRESMPAEPLPWLYGVARRVMANQRRGDTRRAALVTRLAHDRVEGKGGTDPREEQLAAALGALAEGDREVLLLDAWERLTSTEAAAVLGCRPSTYRARLHRARARLRNLVHREDDSPVSIEPTAQEAAR